MALHRARQTNAECLYRILQRPPRGRVAQRNPVLDTVAGPDRSCRLAGRLQWIASAFETRLADALRLRLNLRSAARAGAELRQWLPASSRRSIRPTDQSQPPERTQRWIKLGGNVSGTNHFNAVDLCGFHRTVPFKGSACGGSSLWRFSVGAEMGLPFSIGSEVSCAGARWQVARVLGVEAVLLCSDTGGRGSRRSPGGHGSERSALGHTDTGEIGR